MYLIGYIGCFHHYIKSCQTPRKWEVTKIIILLKIFLSVNSNIGEDLHNLAVEVVDIIKGIAGKDAFSTVYSQVHSNVKTKQLKRKAQQALDRIKIPV